MYQLRDLQNFTHCEILLAGIVKIKSDTFFKKEEVTPGYRNVEE